MHFFRQGALVLALAALCSAEVFKTAVWSDSAASSLEVSLGGEIAVVQSVQTAEDHLILLLVMDTVKFADRVDAVRASLVAKLTSLGPKYFAGVMSAQDGLTVIQDPVRGRTRLREKLQSLDVRGVPGLMDVVEQVSEIADQTLASADVRVAALFVTDGEIEDYRGDYTIPVVNPSDRSDLSRRFRSQLILERVRSIADRLEGAQAPLFFLHLARQYDDLNEVYQNGISEFAQITGGRAMFVRGVQEIPAVVEQLLDEIAAHSVITIETGCEGIHRLEIRSAAGSIRHRETVRCPSAGS
jgi:hypothetical protein